MGTARSQAVSSIRERCVYMCARVCVCVYTCVCGLGNCCGKALLGSGSRRLALSVRLSALWRPTVLEVCPEQKHRVGEVVVAWLNKNALPGGGLESPARREAPPTASAPWGWAFEKVSPLSVSRCVGGDPGLPDSPPHFQAPWFPEQGLPVWWGPPRARVLRAGGGGPWKPLAAPCRLWSSSPQSGRGVNWKQTEPCGWEPRPPLQAGTGSQAFGHAGPLVRLPLPGGQAQCLEGAATASAFQILGGTSAAQAHK